MNIFLKVILNFQLENNYLLYFEKGNLTTGHHSLEMSKKYHYKETSTSTVEVNFENGTPFYKYDLSVFPHFQVQHTCLCDTYSGTFHFSANNWNSGWTIKGPNKDLVIKSFYQPN